MVNTKETKKYCVYKLTAPNGKVYIGMTSQKPEKRWKRGQSYRGNLELHKDILKYGWDNFSREILFNGLNENDAELKEIDLISAHKATDTDFGYNRSRGGRYNQLWTETSRKRLSKSCKGRTISEETRKKISLATRGENHPLFGTHCSEEAKRKMSEKLKGRTYSKETIERMKRGHIGKQSGNAKSILQFTIDGRFIKKYSSATEAGRAVGATNSAISANATGKTKACRGYHWRYADAN